MATITLTDLVVSKLPFGRQYAVWDKTLPTFGIRIGRRSKTFVLKHRNRYFALGRYPIIRLKDAREEARRRLALKYFPPPAVPTKTAIEQFLAAQRARVRPASYEIFQYHLNEHSVTEVLCIRNGEKSLLYQQFRHCCQALPPSDETASGATGARRIGRTQRDIEALASSSAPATALHN